MPFEWEAARAGDHEAQERGDAIRAFTRKVVPNAGSAALSALAWSIPALAREVAEAGAGMSRRLSQARLRRRP